MRPIYRKTREIAWIKSARKDFEKFPRGARQIVLRQLTIVAAGAKPDNAKPMKGLGSGVWEIALGYQTNAYRTIYAIELDETIWIVHAFQKKSPKGGKTARPDIDLIKTRLKRLKERLK